jgi:hypothetical protein
MQFAMSNTCGQHKLVSSLHIQSIKTRYCGTRGCPPLNQPGMADTIFSTTPVCAVSNYHNSQELYEIS